MNIPAAIEQAYAEMLRGDYGDLCTNGTIGSSTTIRPFQSLDSQSKISRRGQREFPCIDIRCGAPLTDEQVTWYCDVMIECKTHNEDDKNHRVQRELYSAVQDVFDLFHDDFMSFDEQGPLWTAFVASVTEKYSGGISIGGLTFVDGSQPYNDDQVNVLPIGHRIHFGRTSRRVAS